MPTATAPHAGLLRPPHQLYIGLVAVLVLGGTLYSAWHGLHLYNVSLSSPTSAALIGAARLPNTRLADRRNLLNTLVIKRAWAWTTAAWLVQAATLRGPLAPAQQQPEGKGKQRADAQQGARPGALAKSAVRYAVATALWGEHAALPCAVAIC
jgi:hypothetical protein